MLFVERYSWCRECKAKITQKVPHENIQGARRKATLKCDKLPHLRLCPSCTEEAFRQEARAGYRLPLRAKVLRTQWVEL